MDYMPKAIATEMMYTGKPISAQRAYNVGMINKVVDMDGLMAAAEEYAGFILQNGPLSIFGTKEIMERGRYMDREGKIALTEHIATPIWNSEDSVEAKQAFLEKRSPQWKLK